MKKLFSCFVSFLLVMGMCACSNKEVKSITLALDEQDAYYTGEDIRIFIETEPKSEITEEDFSIFGGTITVDDNIATVRYNNSGTYHIRVTKDEAESNEITITVTKKLASSGSAYAQDDDDEKEDSQTQDQEQEKEPEKDPEKDPNDFTDWENVRDADASKITSTSDLSSNQGQMILIEGCVPSDGDGSYVIASDGSKIEISGLMIDYIGNIRMYGSYDGSTFRVYTYCAFSSEKIDRDNLDKETEE